MTVADLIDELRKLEPHQNVAVALFQSGVEACDEYGQPVTLNYVPDLDCFGVERVEPMGSWVRLIGSGPYYGD